MPKKSEQKISGLDAAQQSYVEALGRIATRSSLPAIAGKISALLSLSQEPLSFSDIQRRLGVSRGSVSTNTRLLEYIGTIVRIKNAGKRENLFCSAPDVNVRTVELELERYRANLEDVVAARQQLEPYFSSLSAEVEHKVRDFERLLRGRCSQLELFRLEMMMEGEKADLSSPSLKERQPV